MMNLMLSKHFISPVAAAIFSQRARGASRMQQPAMAHGKRNHQRSALLKIHSYSSTFTFTHPNIHTHVYIYVFIYIYIYIYLLYIYIYTYIIPKKKTLSFYLSFHILAAQAAPRSLDQAVLAGPGAMNVSTCGAGSTSSKWQSYQIFNTCMYMYACVCMVGGLNPAEKYESQLD